MLSKKKRLLWYLKWDIFFYGSIIFQDIAYCGGRGGNLHFIPKRSGKNPLRRPCLTRIYFLQRTDANKHKEETAEFDFTGKFILTQHYGFAYTWSYAEWAWKKHCGKTKKAFFFSFLRFWYSMQSSPVFMWRIMTKNKRRLSTTTSRVVCFSNHSTVLENHQKCLTFISATYFMDCTRTHCYGGIDFRLCETIVWKWDFLTFFQPLW